MRYKLTLLKDLPDYPAGTVFKYKKGKIMCLGTFEEREFMGLYEDKELMWPMKGVPQNIVDNPEWFKMEPDFDRMLDLKCPVCGETRGEITCHIYSCGNRYDGYRYTADVFFEYACGHESRQLW